MHGGYCRVKINVYLCALVQREKKGTIAQLVEQRTENPCVLGSIPSGTTEYQAVVFATAFFVLCFEGGLTMVWTGCLNHC